jgi:hypothetical protein
MIRIDDNKTRIEIAYKLEHEWFYKCFYDNTDIVINIRTLTRVVNRISGFDDLMWERIKKMISLEEDTDDTNR